MGSLSAVFPFLLLPIDSICICIWDRDRDRDRDRGLDRSNQGVFARNRGLKPARLRGSKLAVFWRINLGVFCSV
ncbi:MAG: hypothetical protein ACJA1Q_001538 [Pseudohongiellaceae bacterium]|jgi:hypothetical protein